jgi:hypothetical protein
MLDYVRESVSSAHPFTGEGLIRRTALLWVPLACGFALFPYSASAGETTFAIAVVVAVVIVLTIWLAPWERLAPIWAIVPPLLYLLCVALIREAAGAGLSGYGALYFVPAIWVALFGDRLQVAIIILAMGLAVALPPIITDETTNGEWRRTFLTVLAAGAMAYAINSLVFALKQEMHERRELEKRFLRAKALQMNEEVVQDLAVAKYSLDADDPQQAREALDRALEGSKEIVATLIPDDGSVKPGDLTVKPPS